MLKGELNGSLFVIWIKCGLKCTFFVVYLYCQKTFIKSSFYFGIGLLRGKTLIRYGCLFLL